MKRLEMAILAKNKEEFKRKLSEAINEGVEVIDSEDRYITLTQASDEIIMNYLKTFLYDKNSKEKKYLFTCILEDENTAYGLVYDYCKILKISDREHD